MNCNPANDAYLKNRYVGKTVADASGMVGSIQNVFVKDGQVIFNVAFPGGIEQAIGGLECAAVIGLPGVDYSWRHNATSGEVAPCFTVGA